jgi:predicted helicase
MVVMGNPPYSGESINKGEWITALMADYKKEPGFDTPLANERNIKWINDDYVKFIRLGQYFIEKNTEGILAYINNHGFIDNPTFRGMRYKLMQAFDEIYILDLHGNAKKKETAPDGGRDENVFNIQQGVSINIFVKAGQKKNNALAKVFHHDLYGLQDVKYEYLDKRKLSDIPFAELRPTGPEYFFVPKDSRGKAEYEMGFSVAELFTVNSTGIVTARDEFTIHESKEAVQKVINDFLSITDEEARQKYNLGKDVRDWSVAGARKDLQSGGHNIVPIAYRPFDIRFTRYSGVSKGFHCNPRRDVMRNFVGRKNVGLVVVRRQPEKHEPYIFCTNNIISNGYIRSDNTSIDTLLPLYLYTDQDDPKNSTRMPNLNQAILDKISNALGLQFEIEKTTSKTNFAPIDLLDYIYAVLHSPSYREKYKEFLKTDFPRVPYPADAADFRRLATLGSELRRLHLMEHPCLAEDIEKYPYIGSGDNVADKLRFELDRDGTGGKAWINEGQCFDNVPLVAWEFYIGGYQPAQKWLKDRKGRTLTIDDIIHYQKIIAVLMRTREAMREIDV